MTRSYRDDIDWLRAIAVLSVLAFHWDVPPFRGGYVGVDIFFVISGFLITQIIQSEMLAKDFSFARFYERRVRRLLPALYVMIVLIVLPSFYFLLPSERHEFLRSIAAVVTFTSNIFFWQQTDYFARAADEKPLLHTWSLSVEEQFYLVLPLLVWVLLRWQGRAPNRNWILPAGLGIAALASFAFSHWLMTSGRIATAFFMSPPRAWEFLAGSLVAVQGFPVVRNIHLRRIAAGIGLALVLAPAIAYRDGTVFPGAAALLPCAGAAVFIWAGIGGAYVPTTWVPLRVARFFGRISYSLYLWHWPLFIYAKFAKPDLELDAFEKTALFALAVALSYLSYRFVEQPLRRGFPSRRRAFTMAGCGTAALLAIAAAGMTSGSTSDMDARARQLEAYDNYAYQTVYRFGSCFVYDWAVLDRKTCLTPADGKTNVLLWGDSLAAHYAYGLLANIDPARVNLMQVTSPACFPSFTALHRLVPLCREVAEGVAAFVASNKPDLVLISASWVGRVRSLGLRTMIDELAQTLSQFRERGIPVVVLGPPLQFGSRLPSMLLRAEIRKTGPVLLSDVLIPAVKNLDAEMKSAIAPMQNVSYLSVMDTACPKLACPLTLAGGAPLTWDHAHLTAEGSDLVAGAIARALKLSRDSNPEPDRK